MKSFDVIAIATGVLRGELDGLVSVKRTGEWVSVILHVDDRTPVMQEVLHVSQWRDALLPVPNEVALAKAEARAGEEAEKRLDTAARLTRNLHAMHDGDR